MRTHSLNHLALAVSNIRADIVLHGDDQSDMLDYLDIIALSKPGQKAELYPASQSWGKKHQHIWIVAQMCMLIEAIEQQSQMAIDALTTETTPLIVEWPDSDSACAADGIIPLVTRQHITQALAKGKLAGAWTYAGYYFDIRWLLMRFGSKVLVFHTSDFTLTYNEELKVLMPV